METKGVLREAIKRQAEWVRRCPFCSRQYTERELLKLVVEGNPSMFRAETHASPSELIVSRMEQEGCDDATYSIRCDHCPEWLCVDVWRSKESVFAQLSTLTRDAACRERPLAVAVAEMLRQENPSGQETP